MGFRTFWNIVLQIIKMSFSNETKIYPDSRGKMSFCDVELGIFYKANVFSPRKYNRDHKKVHEKQFPDAILSGEVVGEGAINNSKTLLIPRRISLTFERSDVRRSDVEVDFLSFGSLEFDIVREQGLIWP